MALFHPLLIISLSMNIGSVLVYFQRDIAFQAGAQRGDTVTICTTKAIGSATKFIYGHVWNEPGSEGTPKKIIVSTWNHTLPVDDHIKKRWRLNPVSGESETIMRTVPRTQMIKSYFSAACAIDVHNHLRQDGLGLEHSVQTKDWWFRMFCTILGIIEVDTKQPPHSVFTENLVIACLTNTRPGAPAATKHIMELRKRRRQDDEEDTVYQNDVQQIEHEAMPITKYFETRRIKDRLTMQKKQKMSKHGTAVRCQVCPKPAPNANYCCSQCSDENDGNIFGLCGPKSGRVCIPIHQKSMWSSP